MSRPVLKERQSVVEDYDSTENKNPLFDRKIEAATEGLLPCFSKTLHHKLPAENALTIANYILSMKTEINASLNYRKDSIRVLGPLELLIHLFPLLPLEYAQASYYQESLDLLISQDYVNLFCK